MALLGLVFGLMVLTVGLGGSELLVIPAKICAGVDRHERRVEWVEIMFDFELLTC